MPLVYVPDGSDFTVNTHIKDRQSGGKIARLSSGGFVVVWADSETVAQQNSSVRARIYDANGDPITGELLLDPVGSHFFHDAFNNHGSVTGLASGGFVVSWRTTDNTSLDALFRARIYDASGNPVGAEFPIGWNDSIAALPGGGFVTAWSANSLVGAQIFDAAGAKVGAEILVNTPTQGSAVYPSISVLPGGGFAIAWRDAVYPDLTDSTIRSQAFDSAGAKVGPEVVISDVPDGNAPRPDVATLASGDYVVSWEADGAGGSRDVFAQIVTVAGSTVGGPILVNTTTAGQQTSPSIAALPDGGFAVAWTEDADYFGNPRGTDVIVQIFDATGAKVGFEFPASSMPDYGQSGADLAALSDGRLVVSWTDNNPAYDQVTDTSHGTVRARILVPRTDTPVNDAPNIYRLDRDQVTFRASAASPGPMPLDTSDTAVLVDIDSDFVGGSLTVEITTNERPERDILGVRNQGSGAGQIGVSGANISYGGVQFGAIAGGASGEPLIITFGANATSDAVQALVRNIAYSNAQPQDPIAASPKTVIWTLVDGDGTAGGGADTATAETTIHVIGQIHINPRQGVTNGTSGDDIIDANVDGWEAHVRALGGDDIIFYGDTFMPGPGFPDTNDGGDGKDVVVLQGNYAITFGSESLVNIEYLSLRTGADTTWDDLANNRYDYDITMVDANVAAGQRLAVNGQSLLAGEDFTFDGSAETDGYYLVYAGHGVDDLTGGAGDDTFHFEGARLGAGDTVDGGDGADTVVISQGSGVNTIAFGETQLAGIETIRVSAVFKSAPGQVPSYALVLANGNVAGAAMLTVDGSALTAAQTLGVDGSAVVDGRLRLLGGDGDDVLIGGGNDDEMTGNGGADLFTYLRAADSKVALPDQILDFQVGTDQMDLSAIDAVDGGSDDGFSFIGAAAFSSTAGELRAAFDSLNGVWQVEGDVDGDGSADFAIVVTATTADPITASDFVL